MPPQLQYPSLRNVLWHAWFAAEETYAAGTCYYFDNRARQPVGTVALQLTLRGEIAVWSKNCMVKAGPGSLLLIINDHESSYGAEGFLTADYTCRFLNLSGAGLKEFCESLAGEHGIIFPVGDGKLVDCFGKLYRHLTEAKPKLRTEEAGLIHRFLMEFTEYLEQEKSEESTPVERGIRKILEEPLLPWSVGQYALWAGCSREHLSRVFHDETGYILQEYLIRERMSRVKLLLRETRLPVHEVVRQSGFATYHAMANNLRLSEALSPIAYRASALVCR